MVDNDTITFTNEKGELETCRGKNATIIPTGGCTVKEDEIPEKLCFRDVGQGDSKHPQNIARQMMAKYGTMPDMILYQVSILQGLNIETKIIEANDEEYGWIINNQKIGSYELKYFKEYNGIKDVIIYSKVGEANSKLISCYTFDKNGICRVRSMKDFKWRNCIMTNYVIPMFAAFRKQGITFINDSINEITDSYLKERQTKPLIRKRVNKENR